MSKASAAAEPSMEEILASIRRIIADGDSAAPAKAQPAAEKKEKPPAEPVAKQEAPKPKPAPEPKESAPASQDDIDAMMAAMDAEEDEAESEEPAMPEEAEEEVLDLAMARVESEAVAEAMKAPAMPAPQDELEQDVDFADDEFEAMPAKAEVLEPIVPPPPPPSRPMPAMAVTASADSLLSREAEASVSAAFGSLAQAIFSNEPRTIEDIMKELLRPMVKSWLDNNLPAVVERLVREEISRVARNKR